MREENTTREAVRASWGQMGFWIGRGPDGVEVYTAEIVYPKDREPLPLQKLAGQNPGDFGFHYTPYNFDANPEESFFEQMLTHLNLHPEEVEDIYFTGAITDPNKTDFFVEYKDEEGKWRRYTPDFVIRKKPAKGRRRDSGKVYIVEVKRKHDEDHPIDGRDGQKAMAVRKWESLNPDRVKYRMIFTEADVVSYDQIGEARRFVEEAEA